MAAVTELANDVGTSAACQALCMPRASHYRAGSKTSYPAVTASRPSPARALHPVEREAVLPRLHEERFQDRSPAAVYATLLDEGEYHCSIRTMYRLLEAHGEVRERRDQLTHPPYQKPELMATAPNQLWSWDISKLLGPAKWTYFYLYVILDVFSRYVTGWMVAYRESAELAQRLIEESCKFWLEAGAQIPDYDGLAEQITGPHFYYRQGQASHGALMIERKEDMGRRGLEFPDRTDKLLLTHAVDPAPQPPKADQQPMVMTGWGVSQKTK